jgi:aldehyde dehydrogenase (NAD+)
MDTPLLSPAARALLDGVLLENHSLPGAVIGQDAAPGEGAALTARSPIDDSRLAEGSGASPGQVAQAIAAADEAFRSFRLLPAPRRGELVRRYGEKLRANKAALAEFVTVEAGKIVAEAEGEVQEMIDICDFAVGLSRQLYGLTMATERPGHRLQEQWQPIGPVGVISAFNFPVAVWCWNSALAFVCGDPVVWKPSEKANLCALACHRLLMDVVREMEDIPPAVATLVLGTVETGQALTRDPRVPVVSATGSVRMGRGVAVDVGQRLGRTILELGGNNAAIVAPSADLELVGRGSVFAAVGTCGQRCTSLRRLIVHDAVFETVAGRLETAYRNLPIGDPREAGTLVGPLIDEAAFDRMQAVLQQAREAGATVSGGERVERAGYYVQPALVRGLPPGHALVQEETFAPILYLFSYDTIDEAIAIQNGVPQGLSSALFTDSVREAEQFLSPAGSDCGIANINIGTSGAEIGGAFGGEKDTGGGRESGSDAWKAYMRRQTITINGSDALPLAQGIEFG